MLFFCSDGDSKNQMQMSGGHLLAAGWTAAKHLSLP